MKKILLLLSVFALFSCEQEELDGLVESSKAKVEQKAAVEGRAASSTIADFDPIAELDGIQVNLLNMGTTPYKYLSCVKKGNKVDLFDRDDGSMRQRWYLEDNSIKLVGGNQTYAGKDIYVVPNNYLSEEPYPVLTTLPSSGFASIHTCGLFQYINDDLVIAHFPFNGSAFINSYLQPESKNSNNLQYKKGNNDMSTHWRIELVGDDYEFEKIQYVKATGDYVNLQAPKLVQQEYYNRGNPEAGEAIFQVNETVDYSSTFSESETVSISHKISSGMSVGVPSVMNGSISSDITTSYGWSFTMSNTEKKSISITNTYKYIVPPNKDIIMNIYIASYEMNVTYVMTVRRKHDGKLFRVKGKWTGVQGTNIKYRVEDLHSGEVLSQEARDVNGL